MEEKKQVKISLKLAILITIIIMAFVIGICIFICWWCTNINNDRIQSNASDSRNLNSQQIEPTAWKPIIYLYPINNTEVNVKLKNDKLATCVYPKYDSEDGWNVIAKPNGNLIDKNTNRNLYALYYESKLINEYRIQEDGFIVKGLDSAKFLEEKLEILGLTQRESEEFIVYWLPKLEANKYNYIRFANLDEINLNMPLEINPNPDTTIRVFMTYKGLESPINVKEQKLITPKREGFVAVEWGGTEIK